MKIDIEQNPKTLLSIVEMGGYLNFSSLYQQAGFDVTVVTSVRKALSVLKKPNPMSSSLSTITNIPSATGPATLRRWSRY